MRQAAIVTMIVGSTLLAACGHSASPAPRAAAAVPFSTDLGAGRALAKLGNLPAAEQLFGRAVRLQPGSALAHYDLGTVYQGEGDDRDALKQYAASLRIEPGNTSAEFNRAVIYTPTDTPLAEFLYRTVIRAQPTAATAYLNLGLLELRRQPSRADGLADVVRAVRLQPSLRARLAPALRTQLAHRPPASSTTPSVPTTA